MLHIYIYIYIYDISSLRVNKEINKNALLLAVGSLYLKKKSLTPINNVEVPPAIGCSVIHFTFIVTALLTYLFHVAIKLLTEI